MPIGTVAVRLPGVEGRGRAMSARSRHHFTTLRQVNQLIEASEAGPELGFMARLLALCSLPRTNPRDREKYMRRNGPYVLVLTAGGWPARLGRREHRRRGRRHHVRRSPDGRRRVHWQDLADDEPVAEHADRRQVLLDGGRRPGVGPDVGRHVQRRDRLEHQAPRPAPRRRSCPHRAPAAPGVSPSTSASNCS